MKQLNLHNIFSLCFLCTFISSHSLQAMQNDTSNKKTISSEKPGKTTDYDKIVENIQSLIESGKFKEADKLITQLKKSDYKDQHQIYTLEASYLYNSGEAHKSITVYEKALALKPDDFRTKLGLCFSLYYSEVEDGAEKRAERVITILTDTLPSLDKKSRDWQDANNFIAACYGFVKQDLNKTKQHYKLMIDQFQNDPESLATTHLMIGITMASMDFDNELEYNKILFDHFEKASTFFTKDNSLENWFECHKFLAISGKAIIKSDGYYASDKDYKKYLDLSVASANYTLSMVDENESTEFWIFMNEIKTELLLAYSNLENFNFKKQLDECYSILTKLFPHYDLKKDANEPAHNLSNRGLVNLNLGTASFTKPDQTKREYLEKAIKHFKESLEIYKKIKDENNVGITYRLIGMCWKDMPGDNKLEILKKANENLKKSLEYFDAEKSEKHSTQWTLTFVFQYEVERRIEELEEKKNTSQKNSIPKK